MGDRALPAGELARTANVAPQTASVHLSKLLEGELVTADVQGRHRYYRLARPEVGAAVEALASAVPRRKAQGTLESKQSNLLRFARTCYNHLAGTLAVQITDALQKRGSLRPEPDKRYSVTDEGRIWFEHLGLDIEKVASGRTAFARQCLDWTERRHHIAGALGTALLQLYFESNWIARMDRTRAVRITHRGHEQLSKLLWN